MTGVQAGTSGLPLTPTADGPGPGGGSGPQVTTGAHVSGPVTGSSRVTKAIVAVHGIGDQQSYATIQSVVNQFCAFYCEPAGVPLGNFHTATHAFSLGDPYPDEPFARLAFAEAYWAKIPRAMVADSHTVEEAKKWARTIVERLRLRWRRRAAADPHLARPNFPLVNQVLGEMIETIAVVDRLCFLAAKAGLFTFDLRKLLDDYLGDVQVVAEFATEREEILAAFSDVMERVGRTYPNAEIHIVAHSEGTVVAFLGLLAAFRASERPAWTAQVRGLMTLGSPIDKHLALWPELFGSSAPSAVQTTQAQARIQWRNYYDHGDPVGFALDDARGWLARHGWGDVFDFPDDAQHDVGFTRYPFPGKAHVDYWTDDAVFGHYIQNVMRETPRHTEHGRRVDFADPPRSRWLYSFTSYVVPYAGICALLFVAGYVLYKAVAGAIDADGEAPAMLAVARGASGIAALLLGMTVAARVPRLTRSPLARAAAVAVGVLCIGAYMLSTGVVRLIETSTRELTYAGAMVALSLGITAAASVLSVMRPTWGLKPLLYLGGAAVVGVVGYHLAVNAPNHGTLWPLFLATAAMLYLWWLAALLFDLVLVWHVYIRHSKVVQVLRGEMNGQGG